MLRPLVSDVNMSECLRDGHFSQIGSITLALYILGRGLCLFELSSVWGSSLEIQYSGVDVGGDCGGWGGNGT